MMSDAPPRVLSREDCLTLAQRVFALGRGGGDTALDVNSSWVGNLRWARNYVSSGGDTQENTLKITRNIRGAGGSYVVNALDDATLASGVAQAEATLLFGREAAQLPGYPDPARTVWPHMHPKLWFDTTITADAATRGPVAAPLMIAAERAGMLSAGYFEVSANTQLMLNSGGEVSRYYPTTAAQFSVTVRDPEGTGSGWAGVDWNDWTRIETAKLSAIALDKCVRSRHPVAIEPGRYTTILEPQAVCDLVAHLVQVWLERNPAEMGFGPFAFSLGQSKIGQQVVDKRVTLSADPMDPDCGFLPFDRNGEPYRAVKWIEHGVLKELAYDRGYGLALGTDMALPNSGAFRLELEGKPASIDEMIADTERGVLVTRLHGLREIEERSVLMGGSTRDGLWLIEQGKITKPIKNFRFTESPMFALNNIEQFGVPQRVFRPGTPAVVPALKVRDFSFTALWDAV